MKRARKRSGVSPLEAGVALLSLGLLVLLGYTFYDRLQDESVVGGAAQSTVAEGVPAAPDIDDESDLDKAISTLAGINPGDDDDGLQLDDELESFEPDQPQE